MTTNTIPDIIRSTWHAFPWWAWLIIIWCSLSILLALHLGPALKRSRHREEGRDDS